MTASQRAPGQRSAGRRGHDPPRAAGRDRVAGHRRHARGARRALATLDGAAAPRAGTGPGDRFGLPGRPGRGPGRRRVSVRPSVGWVGAVAFAAVPVSFLLGLLRQQLDRSAVGRLVVDLGAMQEGDQLDGLLRTALKDPSVQVAYWRDETAEYVDATGQPVPLPSPEENRAVTVVERTTDRGAGARRVGGRRPALVSGAVAAAGLALENERLHAEVRAQLDEARASRRRAGGGRRPRAPPARAQPARRGAAAAAGRLDAAGPGGTGARPTAGCRASPSRPGLAGARSLSELWEAATGLHPAVLTDHGLAVALEGMAPAPVPWRLVSSS